MSDLLQRLRHHECYGENDSWLQDLCGDAADEIERLQSAHEPQPAASKDLSMDLMTTSCGLFANIKNGNFHPTSETVAKWADLFYRAAEEIERLSKEAKNLRPGAGYVC